MPAVVSHDPGTLNAIEMRSSDPGVGVTCAASPLQHRSRVTQAGRNKATINGTVGMRARYLVDEPAGEEHQVARQRADGELAVERRQRPARVVKHNAAGVVRHLPPPMVADREAGHESSARVQPRLLPELQCAPAP